MLPQGFPDDLRITSAVAPRLAAAGRRVVAFDLLGYGDSDKRAVLWERKTPSASCNRCAAGPIRARPVLGGLHHTSERAAWSRIDFCPPTAPDGRWLFAPPQLLARLAR